MTWKEILSEVAKKLRPGRARSFSFEYREGMTVRHLRALATSLRDFNGEMPVRIMDGTPVPIVSVRAGPDGILIGRGMKLSERTLLDALKE